MAHQHVPIRAGSDIAFLGGIVNYILGNEKYFREYVVAYTNAATILRKDFQDVDDLDGVFSGYDPETGTYDSETWSYEGVDDMPSAGQRTPRSDDTGSDDTGSDDTGSDGGEDAESQQERGGSQELGGHGAKLEHARVRRDETLTDPNCVFQVLKRHYARYTPEMVEDVCGVTPAEFLKVCEAVTRNSGRDRTTAWVYSVGWTHHTVGVQYIRGAAIIQLLLGNMGRPGGGILALRGHASIQGSTDIPTLFNLLPGYLPMPKVDEHDTLEPTIWRRLSSDELRRASGPGRSRLHGEPAQGLLGVTRRRRRTTTPSSTCPSLTGDHGTYQTVMDMIADQVDGYLSCSGQNPAVGSAHGKLQRLGMSHLKWLLWSAT